MRIARPGNQEVVKEASMAWAGLKKSPLSWLSLTRRLEKGDNGGGGSEGKAGGWT